VSGVQVEGTRDFGGPWLALKLISELRIAEHLYDRSALCDLLGVAVGRDTRETLGEYTRG
jgi:hypothetical protein